MPHWVGALLLPDKTQWNKLELPSIIYYGFRLFQAITFSGFNLDPLLPERRELNLRWTTFTIYV